MKKTSTNPTTQKGNPPAKARAGDASKLPTKPTAKPPTVAPPIVAAATIPNPENPLPKQPEISTERPTTATEPTHDPDEEEIMQEFIQKLGSKEKAMAFLAHVSATREKKESAQTPFKTPLQPPNPEGTTVTQAPTFPTENPQLSTDVPALNQPHAEESAVPNQNTEESEAGEGRDGKEDDALVEDMQQGMDVGERGESEERVEGEGKDAVDNGKGIELEVRVGEESIEGEIPSENL